MPRYRTVDRSAGLHRFMIFSELCPKVEALEVRGNDRGRYLQDKPTPL